MSIDSTLKKLDKIAELESNSLLEARLQRAAKVQGILKRRSTEVKVVNAAKKQKRRTTPSSTVATCHSPSRITDLQTFFESYKYKRPITDKEKYFFYLSRNRILDTTDTSVGSQLSLLPTTLKEKVILKKTQEKAISYIDPKLKQILQKENSSLKNKLKEVNEIKESNNKQRVQKEVSRFILDMHVHKKDRFDPKNFPYYSEEDYKVKFWSHLLEELFSTSDADLHWGDTVPKTFLNSSMKPKIDIRIMGTIGSTEPDLAIGEFAKSPTPSKMYHDKLKTVLITKKHLNRMMKNSKSIMAIPFLLIMGFSLTFLEMHFDKTHGYIIQMISSCSFPITKNLVNNDGIGKIINAVEKIKRRVKEIKENTEDHKREIALQKMNVIVESPPNISKVSELTSPVIWPSNVNTKPLDDEDEECDIEDEERCDEDEEKYDVNEEFYDEDEEDYNEDSESYGEDEEAVSQDDSV